MSNNKWLRNFVIGIVLPVGIFMAHSSSYAACVGGIANGLLETGEECDLGTLNNPDGTKSGCNTDCTINTYIDQQTGHSKKWTCNSDGVGYMNMITDNSNPNSLISLYKVLANETGQNSPTRVSWIVAQGICSTPMKSTAQPNDLIACRQYVKDVALFKELNAQVSIETAAGGKDAAQLLNAKCTSTSPEIQDVDTKSFTFLGSPVKINCVPDATNGIR